MSLQIQHNKFQEVNNFKTNRKGFSLVELAIALSIILVISSFGVKSFSEMRIKVHRAEAKSILASLYTMEKTFFETYGAYSARLDALGFNPHGKLYFNYGIARENLTGYPPNIPMGNVHCNCSCRRGGGNPYCGRINYTCHPEALHSFDSTGFSWVDRNSFRIEAHAHLHNDNNQPETWTIDDRRALIQQFTLD